MVKENIMSSPTEKVVQGIHLFNEEGCIYCHKMGEKGGIRGPALTTVQNRLSRNQLIIRIINGSTDMPAYGNSLNNRMDALVEFLLQENRSDKQ